MKKLIVFLCGLIAFIYLLNPDAGLFELIPDNLPIIGNLDEMGATIVLISAFKYFGRDYADIFKKFRKTSAPPKK